MELQLLKMNRNLYKGNFTPDETPAYMSSQVYSTKEAGARETADKNKKDAREVITGTVITACLIKSSDQADRIEIGQSLDSVLSSFNLGSLDFTRAKGLDYLIAYREDLAGGLRIGFLLTGLGGAYLGYSMQATKSISLINSGVNVLQSQSEVLWTISTLGTGEYRITHNLHTVNYDISVMPFTNGSLAVYTLAYITDKGANSFVVNTFDLVGNPRNSDFDCTVDVL